VPLAEKIAGYPGEVAKVELLGSPGALTFVRDATGLDEASALNFVETLRKRLAPIPRILVVSHYPSVIAALPRRLVFTRTGDVSTCRLADA